MSTPEEVTYVYIARCADKTLYTGLTKDIPRRIGEHNGLGPNKGAKYTESRRPVTLVYSEEYDSYGDAHRRERKIKKLGRRAKLNLIKRGV